MGYWIPRLWAWLTCLGVVVGAAAEHGGYAGEAGGHVVPNPAIVMYGHSDNPGFTDAIGNVHAPFTVIEGTSSDATFIAGLRSQGKVYAAHVNNPANETVGQLLARWRMPFDNTLGGALPAGYDAIAVDELHGAHKNGTAHSNAVVSALEQLRALYPDKGIYVATTWQYGQNPAGYIDQLTALNSCADLIMVESYIREGNPSYGLLGLHQDAYATKLKATVPGILAKTVYGLYIAQGGFVADDTTRIGYWGHLDEQFHRIRNDADASTMPGLMFWVYYRSQQDLTPDYVARLVDHYYVQGNTGYFGDGQNSQLIGNAQFDASTAGWTLSPGAGGAVEQFDYSAVAIQNDHDDFGQASHGSHGLMTVRGAHANEASFQVAGVDRNMVHTVSVWVTTTAPARRAAVKITEPDGTVIGSRQVDTVGSPPNGLTTWNEWSRITFNFVPTTQTVNVVLTDAPAAPGTTFYWDFVELEPAYAVTAGAGKRDAHLMRPAKVVQPGG